MRSILLFISLSFVHLTQCHHNAKNAGITAASTQVAPVASDTTIKDSLPECVVKLIEDFKHAPIANPPASIYRYDSSGTTMYYIPATCCDIPSRLLDNNCKLLCMPDGGFTGRGDGKCGDLLKNAGVRKLIWKDSR